MYRGVRNRFQEAGAESVKDHPPREAPRTGGYEWKKIHCQSVLFDSLVRNLPFCLEKLQFFLMAYCSKQNKMFLRNSMRYTYMFVMCLECPQKPFRALPMMGSI